MVNRNLKGILGISISLAALAVGVYVFSKSSRKGPESNSYEPIAEQFPKTKEEFLKFLDSHNKRGDSERLLEYIESYIEKFYNELTESEREAIADQMKNIGNLYYDNKEYERAIEVYTRSLSIHKTAALYSNRAACYKVLKNHQQVIKDCTEAINLEKNYAKPFLRRATAHKALEMNQEALDDYIRVYSLSMDNRMYDHIVDAANRLTKDEYEKLSKRQLDVIPHDRVCRYVFSVFEQTSSKLDYIINLPTNNEEELKVKDACIAIKESRFEDLDKIITSGIDLKSLSPEFFIIIGVICALVDLLKVKYDSAIKRMEELLSAEETPGPRCILSLTYLLSSDNENAKKHMNIATSKFPNNRDTCFVRAHICEEVDDNIDEALKYYNIAIELDPDFMFGYYHKLCSLLKTKNMEEFREFLEKAEKRFEGNIEFYTIIAQLVAPVDPERVQEYINRIQEVDPDNLTIKMAKVTTSLYTPGFNKETLGDMIFNDIMVKDPKSIEIKIIAVKFCIETGKHEKAIEVINDVIQYHTQENVLKELIANREMIRSKIRLSKIYDDKWLKSGGFTIQ